MRLSVLSAGLALVVGLATRAQAVVIEVPVTGLYLRQNRGEMTVSIAKRDDGLIHFTITRMLKEPQYLSAHFRVRASGKVIAESHSPAFVREPSATYYLAVAPENLADAHFELSQNPFAHGPDRDLPLPGGFIFTFDLAQLAPQEAPRPPASPGAASDGAAAAATAPAELAAAPARDSVSRPSR